MERHDATVSLVCVWSVVAGGCEAWEFECASAERCVLKMFMCNGRDDCGDLSDEDETACSQLIHCRQLVTANHDTIRYDTRCYFNVRSKADVSQLNLPHGTDN